MRKWKFYTNICIEILKIILIFIIMCFGYDRQFQQFIEYLPHLISQLQVIVTVMSDCCKYKLLEISRLLSHADSHTRELSRTFRQVMH